MTQLVYQGVGRPLVYEYDGHLYSAAAVDVDASGKPTSDGYVVYELLESITLTPNDCCQSESLIEILLRTNQARRV